MIKITIYSRKDCHLCDIAKEELQELKHELCFSTNEVDIDKDLESFEKYKYLIPVVEMDGEIIFTGRIDRAELKRILTKKSR